MGPQRLKWWRIVIFINDETTKFVTAREGEKRLFGRGGGEYSHQFTRPGETWHEYAGVPPGCGIVPASSGAALRPTATNTGKQRQTAPRPTATNSDNEHREFSRKWLPQMACVA